MQDEKDYHPRPPRYVQGPGQQPTDYRQSGRVSSADVLLVIYVNRLFWSAVPYCPGTHWSGVP